MNEKNCSTVTKEQKNSKNHKELSFEDINTFVKTRFMEVKKANKIKELVTFQATNKFFIMARSQEELKIMGRIVASNNKKNLSEILIEYEKHLNLVLEFTPTVKTHSNVLMHVFGFFSGEFSELEREKFFELQESYKKGKITIGTTLADMHPITYRFNKVYLASQTYFLLYSNQEEESIFKILDKK
tara:strand:- start:157 stop:714 length:558 start_codon:yes stop_codon:yes gene_type:complete